MPIKQGNQQKAQLHQLVGRIGRALDAKEYTLMFSLTSREL